MNWFVVIGEVVAGPHLIAAHILFPLATLTLDVVGVVDQSITNGALVGVALDIRCGAKRVFVATGSRHSPVYTLVTISRRLGYGGPSNLEVD